MADVYFVFYSWRTSQEWTRGDDVKHLSLTLFLTVWPMSWAEDQFSCYFWLTVWVWKHWIMAFTQQARGLPLCSPGGPVALSSFVSLSEISLSCLDHNFPLYERTRRSVLLSLVFNKVAIVVYLTCLIIFPSSNQTVIHCNCWMHANTTQRDEFCSLKTQF